MDLKKHLADLQRRAKQAEADYHAIQGAIQFCEQLIKEQEAENESKNSKLSSGHG
ncbi:MAG: hypothetical protein IJK60_05515 [Clostridia bacterium]|nr:hypothetical protein [Clostridia bacterium]